VTTTEDRTTLLDNYIEPLTWEEGSERYSGLTADVLHIQAQLSQGRRTLDGVAFGREEYEDWRRRAVWALHSKQAHLVQLRAWLDDHKHLAPPTPPRARRGPRTGADASVDAAKVSLAFARQQRRHTLYLEACVQALSAALRRHGGDPDRLLRDLVREEDHDGR
jgi:hypothetical protein